MILTKSKKLNDGRYILYPAKYDEKFRDLARRYPGLIWDKKLKGWIGYSDSIYLLIQKLEEEKVSKVIGELPSTTPSDPLSFIEYGVPLRNYQKATVDFLYNKSSEGALLADETGLGKTKPTLYVMRELGMPWVVVCPAVVKRVWMREAEKIGLSVTILSGVKPPENIKLKKEDGIVIINYDIVYAWLDVLKGAVGTVFDEGHALTNATSRRSKVCRELSHSSKHRIVITASPMTNRTKNLWNIIETISPGRFGSFFSFALRYTNALKETINVKGEEKEIWNFDGASNLEELNARLKHLMLRRTKAEAALELPPKIRQIVEIDVPLNKISREWNLDDTSAVRLALNISAKAKMTQAVELAINHMDEGNNVIIFAHQRSVVAELKDLFKEKGHFIYTATGENSAEKRDDTIQEAAQSPIPCVLAVTTHSMGAGIDLTFANIGIVIELDYVPARIIQMEGRQDRPGQTKNTLLQYLIGIGTIDELIRDAVLNKLEVIEQVIGPTGNNLKKDLSGGKNENDALNELRAALLEMGKEYE